MDCKQCNNALTGRQREFCSDKCRMQHNRGSKANEDCSGSTKANAPVAEHPLESEQSKPEQRTRTVPIPGDADYVGCCKQVDGVWQVDNTKPPVQGMSDDELVLRLHFIDDWRQSPEHAEVMRRQATA